MQISNTENLLSFENVSCQGAAHQQRLTTWPSIFFLTHGQVIHVESIGSASCSTRAVSFLLSEQLRRWQMEWGWVRANRKSKLTDVSRMTERKVCVTVAVNPIILDRRMVLNQWQKLHSDNWNQTSKIGTLYRTIDTHAYVFTLYTTCLKGEKSIQLIDSEFLLSRNLEREFNLT